MNILKSLWIVFALCTANATAQQWLWATATTTLPTNNTQYKFIEAGLVKASRDNSLYTAMVNYGNNVSVGSFLFYDTTLYSGGYQTSVPQTIITKYDLSGNVIWAIANSYGQAIPISIAPDDSGNLYVLGQSLSDSIQFGSLYGINPIFDSFLYNWSSYFLIKISANGNIEWMRTGPMACKGVGWTSCQQGGMAVDKDNNVYIGTSLFISTSNNYPINPDSIFLAKFDPSGNEIWAKTFPGDIEVEVNGMAVYNNRIYIAGNFQSSQLVIGHDTLSYSGPPYASGSSATNCYMAAFDTAGNAIWAKSSHTLAYPNDLHMDKTGNLYMCGHALEGPYMTWGSDSVIIPTEGQAGFLISADTSGNTKWLKVFPQKIPGYSDLIANDVYSITIDSCNHIWISGAIDTPGGIVLDTTALFAAAGSPDPTLIAEFSDSGKLLNTYTLASGGQFYNGIATDSFGNLYVCGDYDRMDPFFIGSNTFHLTNGEGKNFFLAKFNPYVSPVSNTSATLCTGSETTLNAPGGYQKYFWNTDSTHPAIQVYSDGTYTAYCYTPGCRLALIQHIQVSQIWLNSFVVDTSVCYSTGTAVTLDPSAPANSSVTWNTMQNGGTITVAESGSYVAAVSLDGCSATDTFNVDVHDCNCVVMLPDAFTPNGDGLNDVFKVEHQACTFEQFSLSVYSRWGDLLFKTNDPDYGWNGTYKGRKQDVDVYMYRLDYKTNMDHSSRHLKGSVTLVR